MVFLFCYLFIYLFIFGMRFQSSQFTRNLKILNIVEDLDHLAVSKMEDSAATYLLLVQVIGSESIIFQIHY